MPMDLEKGEFSSMMMHPKKKKTTHPAVPRTRFLHCSSFRITMVLASLVFVAFSTFLLRHSADEPPPCPCTVWTVSLLVCAYLSVWTVSLSPTMGAAGVLSRVSYAVLLAWAAAHLSTAWAAGLLGYALADHRQRAGTERAADEAVTLAGCPGRRRVRPSVYRACVFTARLLALGLAARAVWLVFFPTYHYQDQDAWLVVFELSVLVYGILYLRALIIVKFLLHEALVSLTSMVLVMCYFMASLFPSILIAMVSPVLWVYYFGLVMIAMAAFFGYILAVQAHYNYKQFVLARNLFFVDLELGDCDQDSYSSEGDETDSDSECSFCAEHSESDEETYPDSPCCCGYRPGEKA